MSDWWILRDAFETLPIVTTMIWLGGTIAVCLAVYITLRKLSKSYAEDSIRHTMASRLKGPLVALLVLVGLRIALIPLFDIEWLGDQAAHTVKLLAIAVGGWIAIAVTSAFKDLMLARYSIEVVDNYRARKVHTQLRVIYRIVVFFIVLITASAMLMTFDAIRGVGASLLASAGVTGIILGFAAQKTLGSIFAGIQIALTQPIRIEDAVVVEDEWGWIEEITLTYVVIRIWDQRRLVVPITYFVETPFQNWTRQSAEILGAVVLYTDYKVPLEEMRAELKRLVESTDLWNGRVQVLQVIDCTEKTIQIRCLVTGKDSPTTWDLRCYVREGLVNWLQQNYPESLPHNRMILEPAEGQKEMAGI